MTNISKIFFTYEMAATINETLNNHINFYYFHLRNQ